MKTSAHQRLGFSSISPEVFDHGQYQGSGPHPNQGVGSTVQQQRQYHQHEHSYGPGPKDGVGIVTRGTVEVCGDQVGPDDGEPPLQQQGLTSKFYAATVRVKKRFADWLHGPDRQHKNAYGQPTAAVNAAATAPQAGRCVGAKNQSQIYLAADAGFHGRTHFTPEATYPAYEAPGNTLRQLSCASSKSTASRPAQCGSSTSVPGCLRAWRCIAGHPSAGLGMSRRLPKEYDPALRRAKTGVMRVNIRGILRFC